MKIIKGVLNFKICNASVSNSDFKQAPCGNHAKMQHNLDFMSRSLAYVLILFLY